MAGVLEAVFPWRLGAVPSSQLRLASEEESSARGWAGCVDRCSALLLLATLGTGGRGSYTERSHFTLSTAAANSVLGLGLLSGQQATHCQLVWAHLQLVLVLGLTRDQGRSLTARLCRWTRF